MKVYDSIANRWFDSHTYTTADQLLKLSKTKGLWDTISAVISAWKKLNPKKWQSYLIDSKDIRDSRRNEYGSTKDKSLRYLLDIPEPILRMIRIIYSTDDLPMDGTKEGKRFFRTFAKKFPEFTVPQKV